VTEVEVTDPGLRDALAAVRRAPTIATHLAAAREYQRLGIFDRALDHLDRGVAIDTFDPAVNDAIARVWRDWGMPGLGLAHAHRAVYAAPRSATARHTLGTVLHALGHLEEAENSFQEAAGLDPSAWYAWQNLCTITLKAGRTQQAILYCQRAASARTSALETSRHERH
jgi:tetratricopeptide (TPR) repeat protein